MIFSNITICIEASESVFNHILSARFRDSELRVLKK